MTRWARGGTANTKKPHEPTLWEDLQGKSDTSKRRSAKNRKKHGQSDKKTADNTLQVTKHEQPEAMKLQITESKVSKKVLDSDGDSSDSDKIEERIGKFHSSKSPSFGIAAELEKLGTEYGMEEQVIGKPALKKDITKVKKNKNKNKLIVNVGSKTQKLLKTELTENLSTLRKSLSLSKLEEAELESVINKDQRREKRRLKRIDKKAQGKVCFNCRQKGHTVSECPESNSVGQGAGICFKCGSTEHSVAQCRIKLPEGRFPYAKCFICGEQGHMSKQCPDNPRGLYPNGGCCRTCSSVEHYNKDCPLLQQQQGIADYRLGTIKLGSVDEEVYLAGKQSKPKSKKPKLVIF